MEQIASTFSRSYESRSYIAIIRSVWKMCTNIPGIKLERTVNLLGEKIENLSVGAHVLRMTTTLVISRRCQDANANEIFHNY